MIIVLGSAVIKDGCIEEALEISQQHVERSGFIVSAFQSSRIR